MTPAARYQAAIEILERVMAGEAAEAALIAWARQHRFAGSKDRRAIRDIVFDGLRSLRSAQAASGIAGARGVVAGLLRLLGQEPGAVFGAGGYGPEALSAAEQAAFLAAQAGDAAQELPLDLPDWLVPELESSLGAQLPIYAQALRDRAPVDLRFNRQKTTAEALRLSLAEAGYDAELVHAVPSALRLVGHPQGLERLEAYAAGLFEFQDSAPQAAMLRLSKHLAEWPQRFTALDYCAGGGGKTVALADLHPQAQLYAHDQNPARLKELARRAAQAGHGVTLLHEAGLAEHGPYDLVIADVPCSGSGAWRRQADGRWRLTEARLAELEKIQAQILCRAAELTARNGLLAYMTCSVLARENEAQVAGFLAQSPQWACQEAHHMALNAPSDGFYLAILQRKPS